MPTDVAVTPAGDVFIADGVNDRVVYVPADGGAAVAIHSIGDERLSRPVGVAVDATGRLHVADTGHGRAIIRNTDGTALVIKPGAKPGPHGPDITDVAPSPDGSAVWLVDNEHHRLVRHDMAGGTQMEIGRPGESLGQLQFPFLAAVSSTGHLHVIDVINGRVSVFSDAGRPVRAIGGYGVEAGELYRPKGVAVDGAGRVWVSDSVLGVVQVFNSDGGLLDVLRTPDGAVLRLTSPMGLAVVADRLWVVELSGDRVSRFRLRISEAAPRSRPRASRPQIVGQQARSCTVCHLEWVPPLAGGASTEIAAPPPSTPASPFVSRAEMCLSCHDGGIADSRRRVWLEHGHRTDVPPRPGMTVPDELPLVDGRIACRTCHTAHAGGNFTGDMATSIFLRVENSASQLCISCHADYTRGPSLGNHPTGGMPWPIPESLIAAGSKVGPNNREITCQVCHTPHGSSYDHLLVLGTSSNELCVTCHEQMRPGMFREDTHAAHPLSAVLNAEQKATVERLGTRMGPDDQIICLSCHKLHQGKGERFMLAAELTDSEMCISCHSEKQAMLGSSHDLRTNFPEEKNRLGMTAGTGGPCSSCHMFHRYARAPETHPLDPRGQCITCHQPDRCGEKVTLGTLNHPAGARCTDCHNPHELKHPHYLAGKPEDLCTKCHADYTALAGGPHDWRHALTATGAGAAATWPEAALAAGDRCLSCHRPHGDEAHGLFRVAPAKDQPSHEAACIACHTGAAQHAAGDMAALHPRLVPAGAVADGLPTFEGGAADQRVIACLTCHNPHAGGQTPSLVRVQTGQPAAQVCSECHRDVAPIALTAHAPDRLLAAGLDAHTCTPCHAVHGDAGRVESRRLTSVLEFAGDAALSNVAASDRMCLSCHRADGPAARPDVYDHPVLPMRAISDALDQANLPLFDAAGEIAAEGQIGCPTCHVPHGHAMDAAEMARLAALSPAERSATRLLLRAFRPPNVCTTCHGADALRRFLYYHDRERRGGTLLNPSALRELGGNPAATNGS